jgi:uncharacterized RDD family membrane protein YckC
MLRHGIRHRRVTGRFPSPTFGEAHDRERVKTFHAHETSRAEALEGTPLATFRQRTVGFAIDFAIVSLIRKIVGDVWDAVPHVWERHTLIDITHVLSAAVFFVYFTLALYIGNGRTPGKWIARTSVVSLKAPRLTLWQSFERALGYGASVVEAGLGFLQFFRNRNSQCAHDRLAETIVVDLRR